MLLHERTNARLLLPGALLADLPEGVAPPAFLAMDVSFISATLVLPAVIAAMGKPGTPWSGEAVILVKPQFEAGRENVGAGGIVRDPAAWTWAVERVRSCVRDLGGEAIDVIDSPILGREGNREYLLHCRFGGGGAPGLS